MAAYIYRCAECGTEDTQEFPIGTARRQASCVCGNTMRLVIGAGVQVAPPNAATEAANATEARWNKDMPAYYRMRKKGLQPSSVDGAAALEDKVGSQMDIAYHKLYEQGVTPERIVEGAEQVSEIMANGVPL